MLYHCKKLILSASLDSDLSSLSAQLQALAQDSMPNQPSLVILKQVISEIIACFPVYRTFITPDSMKSVAQADKAIIEQAVDKAKKVAPHLGEPLFDFVKDTVSFIFFS
jgi:(1->4)-alpha-D-glucan 1-alpha-D-glucosylmutase